VTKATVPFAFVKNVVQISFFYDCNYLSFRKHKKCPLSSGKVPFAFVKNVVQIAFCMIAVPPPVVKEFSGALFIPKVPLETAPPPNPLMLPTPLVRS
jgi:hypothetical protein